MELIVQLPVVIFLFLLNFVIIVFCSIIALCMVYSIVYTICSLPFYMDSIIDYNKKCVKLMNIYLENHKSYKRMKIEDDKNNYIVVDV